jgi:hypothetical protein
LIINVVADVTGFLDLSINLAFLTVLPANTDEVVIGIAERKRLLVEWII